MRWNSSSTSKHAVITMNSTNGRSLVSSLDLISTRILFNLLIRASFMEKEASWASSRTVFGKKGGFS